MGYAPCICAWVTARPALPCCSPAQLRRLLRCCAASTVPACCGALPACRGVTEHMLFSLATCSRGQSGQRLTDSVAIMRHMLQKVPGLALVRRVRPLYGSIGLSLHCVTVHAVRWFGAAGLPPALPPAACPSAGALLLCGCTALAATVHSPLLCCPSRNQDHNTPAAAAVHVGADLQVLKALAPPSLPSVWQTPCGRPPRTPLKASCQG